MLVIPRLNCAFISYVSIKRHFHFEYLQFFPTGGASTHFHILSPESRKYFNRAILMSGSALNFWALSAVDNHVYSAFNMANIWQQPQSNLTNLVEWLKIFPAQKFLEFSRPNFGDAGIHEFPFVPIIERTLTISTIYFRNHSVFTYFRMTHRFRSRCSETIFSRLARRSVQKFEYSYGRVVWYHFSSKETLLFL